MVAFSKRAASLMVRTVSVLARDDSRLKSLGRAIGDVWVSKIKQRMWRNNDVEDKGETNLRVELH